ncbi:MAG: response regulator [Verrucomicrobiales bacterium]
MQGNDHAKKPLLVIDDDRKLCRLIRDYLTVRLRGRVCAHRLEGLERSAEREWHAVLLDVMLPGMDGFEVLRALRKRSNVPVLMLTALGEEPDRTVGLRWGRTTICRRRFRPANCSPGCARSPGGRGRPSRPAIRRTKTYSPESSASTKPPTWRRSATRRST